MGRLFFFIIEILIVISIVMLLLDWLAKQGTHNTKLKNLKKVLDEMNDDCSPKNKTIKRIDTTQDVVCCIYNYIVDHLIIRGRIS